MTRRERRLLLEVLKGKKNYLEFGTGGSTIEVLRSTNVHVCTVDSDKKWLEAIMRFHIVQKALRNHRLTVYHADIGPVTAFGYPAVTISSDIAVRYYQGVFEAFDLRDSDVVFIDGRFRVACTLMCIKNLRKNCVLMIHDFWNRPQYHTVLKYLDVIKHVDSLAVFVVKDTISHDELLDDIRQYSAETF